MGFLLPLKHYKLEDFDSVIISLEAAERHHSVIADNERRTSQRTLVDAEKGQNAEPKAISDSDSANKHDIALPSDNSKAALEALRAEIDADIGASGHDTAYDRKSKVVNKAIQDIGMGRYNWELFVLCGFGWFADNVCMTDNGSSFTVY